MAEEMEADDATTRQLFAELVGRNPEHDFDPTLARTQRLLEVLGNPQRAYKVVLVAGTNGKSSTSRMIASLVREHGLRTGLFTSPHLVSVRERIEVDGEPLTNEAFARAWEDVYPYVQLVDQELAEQGQSRLSFFEVLTALAYAAFADAPVDVAVVEVGMGGEWDSTNAADADVAVLTPIALDHQRWLGDDIETIAATKAKIIKHRAQVVVGGQEESVQAIIAAQAAAQQAHLVATGFGAEVAERKVAVGGQLLSLQTPAALYTEVFLPLHGEFQADNALVALLAVEALMNAGGALPAEVVEAGFARVKNRGRLQLLRSHPTVIADVAHNPAGMVATLEAVDEVFGFPYLIAVFAAVADKDIEVMVAELEPKVDEIVVFQLDSPRAMDVEDLAEIAIDSFGEDRVHSVQTLVQAVDVALGLSERASDFQGGILITGSVLTAGLALELFEPAPGKSRE